jgi:hypothetical protein
MTLIATRSRKRISSWRSGTKRDEVGEDDAELGRRVTLTSRSSRHRLRGRPLPFHPDVEEYATPQEGGPLMGLGPDDLRDQRNEQAIEYGRCVWGIAAMAYLMTVSYAGFRSLPEPQAVVDAPQAKLDRRSTRSPGRSLRGFSSLLII